MGNLHVFVLFLCLPCHSNGCFMFLQELKTAQILDVGVNLRLLFYKSKQKKLHHCSPTLQKSLCGFLNSIWAERECYFWTESYFSAPFDIDFSLYQLTSNAIIQFSLQGLKQQQAAKRSKTVCYSDKHAELKNEAWCKLKLYEV